MDEAMRVGRMDDAIKVADILGAGDRASASIVTAHVNNQLSVILAVLVEASNQPAVLAIMGQQGVDDALEAVRCIAKVSNALGGDQ